jgi:hypothetical protein
MNKYCLKIRRSFKPKNNINSLSILEFVGIMPKPTRVNQAVIFNWVYVNHFVEVYLVSNSTAFKAKVDRIVAIISVEI